MIIVEDL